MAGWSNYPNGMKYSTYSGYSDTEYYMAEEQAQDDEFEAATATRINSDADFDVERNLPSHVQGMRDNDLITLASLFNILAHVAGCCDDGAKYPCQRCYPDGN